MPGVSYNRRIVDINSRFVKNQPYNYSTRYTEMTNQSDTAQSANQVSSAKQPDADVTPLNMKARLMTYTGCRSYAVLSHLRSIWKSYSTLTELPPGSQGGRHLHRAELKAAAREGNASHRAIITKRLTECNTMQASITVDDFSSTDTRLNSSIDCMLSTIPSEFSDSKE